MNIGVSLQRNFTIENCVDESKFQTSVKGVLMLWWITPSTNNNALTHSHGNKCQLEKCHCSIDTDLSTHQLPPLCHPSLLRKYSSIKLLSLGKLPMKEMTKTGPTRSAESICSCLDIWTQLFNDIFTDFVINSMFIVQQPAV